MARLFSRTSLYKVYFISPRAKSKKHVRDADDHVGALCEIRVVALHRRLSVRLSVCPSVRLLLTELVRAP